MFGVTGGYFRLDSWIMSNIIQLGTQRFCREFLNLKNDPGGRQFAQMTQAARSGCANNAEGSARHATSRETEMRLTDVARGSLAELSGDYINWILFLEKVPWRKKSPESREIYDIRLDNVDYTEDVVHDACLHILKQKKKFAKWLESEDSVIVANCLLILIARVINMLNHQMDQQGESFKTEGGFRENLTRIRVEEKSIQNKNPLCPECQHPMLRRQARNGKNAGNDFWVCSKYPECTGIRKIAD